MLTYCPSCGVQVPPKVVTARGRRAWLCPHCRLVFREEQTTPVPGLARAPRPAKAGAAPPAASPPRAAAGKAPPPLPWEASSGPSASAGPADPREAAPEREYGIDLTTPEDEAFVIVSSGEERLVTTGAQRTGRAPRAPANPLDDLLESPGPPPVFPTALIAEDLALLREVLKDALLEKGISTSVHTSNNGEQLVEAVAAHLAAGVQPDLLLIDVEMPVLNGYFAAVAVRALERGLGARPAPIVFFTAHACDEALRRMLEYCRPARYLNKGTDAAPARVAGRLAQVLATMRR